MINVVGNRRKRAKGLIIKLVVTLIVMAFCPLSDGICQNPECRDLFMMEDTRPNRQIDSIPLSACFTSSTHDRLYIFNQEVAVNDTVKAEIIENPDDLDIPFCESWDCCEDSLQYIGYSLARIDELTLHLSGGESPAHWMDGWMRACYPYMIDSVYGWIGHPDEGVYYEITESGHKITWHGGTNMVCACPDCHRFNLMITLKKVEYLNPAELDTFIIETMDTHYIAGLSACIIKDSVIIWSANYGYAEVYDEIEVADTTLFLLASISKTFTGTALMQLFENGMFELDDDINDYLPFEVINPNYPATAITFRMLLSHTSSIIEENSITNPLVSWGSDCPIPLDSFLYNYLNYNGSYYEPMLCYGSWEPGSQWEYSNVGVGLVGYLVEAISGIPFDQYCHDSIFAPLSMNETAWFLSDLNLDNLAVPYRHNGIIFISYQHFGFPYYPAGQLRTSALQLARFLTAFMRGGQIEGVRILESATVDSIKTIQYPDLEPRQGLIWINSLRDGRLTWWHNGGTWGTRTEFSFCPDENTGVVILSNGEDIYSILDIENQLYEFAGDVDEDGIVNGMDNCPGNYNPDQADGDLDGIGDVCDSVLCGDTNDDDIVNVSDAVYIINYVFMGGNPPNPIQSGDANCDEIANISDAVWVINYVFAGGYNPCDTDGDGLPNC